MHPGPKDTPTTIAGYKPRGPLALAMPSAILHHQAVHQASEFIQRERSVITVSFEPRGPPGGVLECGIEARNPVASGKGPPLFCERTLIQWISCGLHLFFAGTTIRSPVFSSVNTTAHLAPPAPRDPSLMPLCGPYVITTAPKGWSAASWVEIVARCRPWPSWGF